MPFGVHTSTAHHHVLHHQHHHTTTGSHSGSHVSPALSSSSFHVGHTSSLGTIGGSIGHHSSSHHSSNHHSSNHTTRRSHTTSHRESQNSHSHGNETVANPSYVPGIGEPIQPWIPDPTVPPPQPAPSMNTAGSSAVVSHHPPVTWQPDPINYPPSIPPPPIAYPTPINIAMQPIP